MQKAVRNVDGNTGNSGRFTLQSILTRASFLSPYNPQTTNHIRNSQPRNGTGPVAVCVGTRISVSHRWDHFQAQGCVSSSPGSPRHPHSCSSPPTGQSLRDRWKRSTDQSQPLNCLLDQTLLSH